MKFLHKIFNKAQKDPNEIAICSREKISYRVMWKKASNLAFFFKEKKIDRICILQSEKDDYACYIIMLASLISGGTYIPVNNSTPINRIKQIIKSSKADILISKKKINTNFKCKEFFFDQILKQKKEKNISINNSKKDAYIIFTSGSTGHPKGVRISRKSLDHYILWISQKFFNDKVIKCSQHPGIGFDLSVADIFGTLAAGGTLYPIQNAYDKLFLNKFIKRNKLTHWVSVPSVINLIFDTNFFKKNDVKSLKKMFFCGETLKKLHLQMIWGVQLNFRQMQIPANMKIVQ